jgi:hypothetical protein
MWNVVRWMISDYFFGWGGVLFCHLYAAAKVIQLVPHGSGIIFFGVARRVQTPFWSLSEPDIC